MEVGGSSDAVYHARQRGRPRSGRSTRRRARRRRTRRWRPSSGGPWAHPQPS